MKFVISKYQLKFIYYTNNWNYCSIKRDGDNVWTIVMEQSSPNVYYIKLQLLNLIN